MRKTNIISTVIILCATACLELNAASPVPTWLESDSAMAVRNRTLSDFSLTFDQAVEALQSAYPGITTEEIRNFIDKRYVESKTIDGQLRIHRKALRNLRLLNPDMNGGAVPPRGASASADRIAFVDSVLSYYRGTNPEGNAHSVTYRFTIDVPYHPEIVGDTLRVWMPVPLETQRQSDVRIISTSQRDYIVSSPEQSVHHTIYFTAPAPNEGDTAHFEYTGSFVTRGEYFSPEFIKSHLKPYDKTSDVYREFTAFQTPHIVRMDSLAHAITAGGTDPYRCSELVYDYIISHYPWAGALEYSTIDCIPQYVVRERHGDCGQVALLYISLMRTLGIPARWESGWMLHPGEKNLHDWAEVYFEGIGWLPVDASFGRYITAPSADITNFYSTGMDAHRFVSNKGVCGDLFPAKKYLRSETVDFQLGEVECSRGNLFYPAWSQHLTLLEVKPIK